MHALSLASDEGLPSTAFPVSLLAVESFDPVVNPVQTQAGLVTVCQEEGKTSSEMSKSQEKGAMSFPKSWLTRSETEGRRGGRMGHVQWLR